MNSLKSVNGSYRYTEEMLYCMDFGLLGFNDWTDLNDEGVTWAAQDEESGKAILICLHAISYDIVIVDSDLNLYNGYELFVTNDMGELWSIIRSNLKYFDQLLTKERG